MYISKYLGFRPDRICFCTSRPCRGYVRPTYMYGTLSTITFITFRIKGLILSVNLHCFIPCWGFPLRLRVIALYAKCLSSVLLYCALTGEKCCITCLYYWPRVFGCMPKQSADLGLFVTGVRQVCKFFFRLNN